MDQSQAWLSLLAGLVDIATDLSRYTPTDEDLKDIREVERTLQGIRWECEDTGRPELEVV